MRKMKTKKQLTQVLKTIQKEKRKYQLSCNEPFIADYYINLYRIETEIEILNWVLGENEQKTVQNDSTMDKEKPRTSTTN